MKKIFALILVACMLMSLCSCALIRKIEPADTSSGETTEDISETKVDTDFSETKEEENTSEEEIRYTEDEAYDLLVSSLGITEEGEENTDETAEEKQPTITKTGAIIAQSNGTEYYIFEVEYPEKETDEESSDTEAEDAADSETAEEESGKKAVYVSTNGIVYESLEEANTTTLLAADTYTVKHGEVDEETGFKYKVEYQGLIKNLDLYCYNFIVYLEDDSSGTVNYVYKTNYLVTLDGKSSGEQKLN